MHACARQAKKLPQAPPDCHSMLDALGSDRCKVHFPEPAAGRAHETASGHGPFALGAALLNYQYE